MATLSKNALTTLENVRAFVNAPPEQDTLLILIINQASATIESQLDRKLGLAEYTEYQQANGRQIITTAQYPIAAVKCIKLSGQKVPPQLYDHQMKGDWGGIYKDDGWTYEGYPHGLAGDNIAAKRNLEIKYTAGYILPKDGTDKNPVTLPDDIEGLCISMVQDAYGRQQNGGNAGLRSFAISDVRWEWNTETPQSWLDTIARHRRVWL